jgi:UDP-glucuronate decarboxylase
MTPGQPKTILVTGGAGFLGSHLCERLLRCGQRVLCLDSFRTGTRANIAAFEASRDFRVIAHDVTEKLPRLPRVHEIYNLACVASPLHYRRDPVHTMRTSILGALHVLELAQRTGARILQASTSEIYGDPLEHPQREVYCGHVNPIGPRACYDEGKRAAETLFFDFRRRHGLTIKVARIFNTYGPRMGVADGRVVSTLIAQALRGEPLTIFGSGRQTRSFCYVCDLIDGLVRLMASEPAITGPINLGNPQEVAVLTMAQQIRKLTGSTSPIRFLPAQEDDPQRRRPAIELAERLLGWRPMVGLEEGLWQTIGYLAGQVDQPQRCPSQHLMPDERGSTAA